MKKFKYELDRSSKKFICPSCDKKTFVRYKDVEGNYITDETFGRCDREVNCGYLKYPTDKDDYVFVPPVRNAEPPPSYIDRADVDETLQDYYLNPLCQHLVQKIGEAGVIRMVETYRFGIDRLTISNRDWVVFWQYDVKGKIRSGKMIKYDNNGHRDKAFPCTWFHKCKDKYSEFNLKQCLYGEHLLAIDPRKPVAIVESEKTAVIASHFIPEYVWLACGSKTGLSASKLSALRNRNVTLFPDLGAYDEWKIKAREFSFNVSDHIEKIATDDDRGKGLDLADFLLR
ncbi:hypothetical protein FKG96_09935 [Olivibacter sp. LS-1]|uniref:DUF6371 domain-containing protein n=1 Tax=Olivibacter sp. LS-1 TaxID=2592345 RepID=UPI0011EB69D7|nr:DUF6371 domain-containing protein [Olivibacter sp. LS-1]QEL01113.1 hypothetical protein FKG96_09935 [Olivibacter sp. LS-1]